MCNFTKNALWQTSYPSYRTLTRTRRDRAKRTSSAHQQDLISVNHTARLGFKLGNEKFYYVVEPTTSAVFKHSGTNTLLVPTLSPVRPNNFYPQTSRKTNCKPSPSLANKGWCSMKNANPNETPIRSSQRLSFALSLVHFRPVFGWFVWFSVFFFFLWFSSRLYRRLSPSPP